MKATHFGLAGCWDWCSLPAAPAAPAPMKTSAREALKPFNDLIGSLARHRHPGRHARREAEGILDRNTIVVVAVQGRGCLADGRHR